MKHKERIVPSDFGAACPWCSGTWDGQTGTRVYHSMEPCPYVKEIEFFPDGSVKRVVFKDDPDFGYELDEDEEEN